MSALHFPDGTFVVVATGHSAKTFHVKNGSLAHDADWTPQDLKDDGPAGKTPPDLSSKDIDEATFSKQIADKLNTMALQNALQSLILVADPGTLGEIRPLLHREVVEKVLLEQAKTLINSPVEDIERSLAA